MEYNPEFWNPEDEFRHRVMPAFGALVMADYHEFITSREVAETIHANEAITRSGLTSDRESWPVNAEYHRPLPDQAITLLDSFGAIGKLASIASLDNYRQLMPFELTEEQLQWQKQNIFFGTEDRGLHFLDETRAGGIRGAVYFAHGHILAEYARSRRAKPELIFHFLKSSAFAHGLRQASAAHQEYWETPDSDIDDPEMLQRLDKKRVTSYPFFDETGLSEYWRTRVKEDRHTHTRYSQELILESHSPLLWGLKPSSGCPVRHATLGPNVQAAFTEEQRERISSTVAEIDEHGVMTYTWDPFQATAELIVPVAEEIYRIERRRRMMVNGI